MATEKLRQVTKAVFDFAVDGEKCGLRSYPGCGPSCACLELAGEIAKTALQATREPTGEMTSPGGNEGAYFDFHRRDDSAEVFRRMIDSALGQDWTVSYSSKDYYTRQS